MNMKTALFPAVILSLAVILLTGCSTTPDESYKESQMTKSLDYPPDLVAPTLNQRFSVPQSAPQVDDVASDVESDD